MPQILIYITTNMLSEIDNDLLCQIRILGYPEFSFGHLNFNYKNLQGINLSSFITVSCLCVYLLERLKSLHSVNNIVVIVTQ